MAAEVPTSLPAPSFEDQLDEAAEVFDRIQLQPRAEPRKAADVEYQAIFQDGHGEWIGDFGTGETSPKKLTVSFHCSPGDLSTIECRSYLSPQITSIPALNRNGEYIQKVVLNSKALFNAETGTFDFTVKPLPSDGFVIPRQILGLRNHQYLLQTQAFRILEITYKAHEIIREHLTNNITIIGGDVPSAARAEAFKRLFKDEDGEVNITAIVLWSPGKLHTSLNLDHLRDEFMKDIRQGNMYRQFFEKGVRLLPSYPPLHEDRLLPSEERPNVDHLKLQLTYPNFPEMATLWVYGILELHEREKESLEMLRKSKGHSVKILTHEEPTLKLNRWLGLFYIDTKLLRQLKDVELKQNVKFTFRFRSPERVQSPKFTATIAEDELQVLVAGGESGEVVAWIDRHRVEIPQSSVQNHDLPPYNTYKVLATQVIQANYQAAIKHAPLVEVEEIKIQSIDVTFKRQMSALASYAEVTMDDSSKRNIPAERICMMHEILSGKLVSSKKDVNIIGSSEEYLNHHKDEDMVNVIQYLKTCPNGFGIIWGPAGTGKTRTLAEIARCKVLAALFEESQMRNNDGGASNPARILFTAPSNSACDVIVNSLRKSMGNKAVAGKKLLDKAIVVRAHIISTENSFIRACAALVGRKSFHQLSNVEVAKYKEIGLLQDGTPVLNKIIKPKKFNYGQPMNHAGASGSKQVGGSVEKEFGTGPAELKDLWEIDTTVYSSSTRKFVDDPRFVQVKDSLGYLMLQTSGLLHSTNRHTNPAKWATFRRYHTLSMEGKLSDEDEEEYKKSRDELRDFCIGITDILVSTCINSASPVYRGKFLAKHVFADEASLAGFGEMVAVMESYPFATYVIAGDPKQLHPVVKDLENLRGCITLLQYSLLEMLLSRHYPHVLLMTQHRAASGLMDIANALFYENLLKDAPDASDENKHSIKAKLINFMNETFPASGSQLHHPQTNKSYLHLDIDSQEEFQHESRSAYNTKNACLILNLVETMVAKVPGLTFKDITVVVPYKKQRKIYIRAGQQIIEKSAPRHSAAWERNRDKWNSLTYATTDSYQGGSNKIIIVDMVRSGTPGFLNNLGRMCVNMTRAEQALFVVGNSRKICSDHSSSWPAMVYNAFKNRGRQRNNIDGAMLRHRAVDMQEEGQM